MEGEGDAKMRDANCQDSYLTYLTLNEERGSINANNDVRRKTGKDDTGRKKTVYEDGRLSTS